jgi:hypothetical protein
MRKRQLDDVFFLPGFAANERPQCDPKVTSVESAPR